MLFEYEVWAGGKWQPSAELGYPQFMNEIGDRVLEEAFLQQAATNEIRLVVDEDTDVEGWSYGAFFSKIGNKRPMGRRVCLPSDRVRRRRWVKAHEVPSGAASSSRSRMSIGPRVEDTDLEAIGKIVQLLGTYLGKRSASDWLSVASDPTVVPRLVLQHRRAYEDALEATCEPMSARNMQEQVELLADIARAAAFANAAYGAPFWKGHLDTVATFAGGAAAHFLGTWTPAENSSAFVKVVRIADEDLLLSSWEERTFEPAFCVAWARERKWLVLSVRGTVDWRAIMTDVAAQAVPISGGLAHEGMLRAAQSVVERSLTTLKASLAARPDYHVVCTGHSLGAGVAALVALLLREGAGQEDPPALRSARAYGMGMPPLMDPDLAHRSQDWIVSVVRGLDFISRLSVFSVDRLVFELTQASAGKMATDWFMKSIGRRDAAHQRFQRNFGEGKEIAQVLLPPGRILHLDTRSSRQPGQAPQAYWACATFYQRYLLGTTMLMDHLPSRYQSDLGTLVACAASAVAVRDTAMPRLTAFCSEPVVDLSEDEAWE